LKYGVSKESRIKK